MTSPAPLTDLAGVVERFAGRAITVAGDVIADRYVHGRASRLAREAPVPVVRVSREEICLGGAGNVAHNLAALGARVRLVGVVGADATGADVLRLARDASIDNQPIVIRAHRRTPTRTRVLASAGGGDGGDAPQQLLRIDHDPTDPIGRVAEAALADALGDAAHESEPVVVADYGLGTMTARVIERVRALAARPGALVAIDSRWSLAAYAGVTVVTPSEDEAAALCGTGPVDGDEAAQAIARAVQARLDTRHVLLTRGRRGMAIALADGTVHLVPARDPAPLPGAWRPDATGAGDTATAVFVLALASGASPLAAGTIAATAAAIAVAKLGTATVSQHELLAAVRALGPRALDSARAFRAGSA